METWIILAAFVAPIAFSLINFFDKFLIDKISTPKSLFAFSGLFTFVIALIVFVYAKTTGKFISIPAEDIFILILSGVMQLSWVYLYLKALSVDESEVSSVIPWFEFVGVFTFFLAYFILGETLTANNLVNIGMIIFGGILLSVDFSQKFRFRKESFYMLCASFIIALSFILFKESTPGSSEFVTSAFWAQIGMGLTGLFVVIFFKSFRTELIEMIQKNGKKVLRINILNEVLNGIGLLAVGYAVLQTEAAKVMAFGSTQSFYVLLFGIIGSVLFPKYIQENHTIKSVIPKVIAIAFMVIGGFLLQWN